MMNEEDADQPAPDEACPNTYPAQGYHSAQDGGYHQTEEYPDREESAGDPKVAACTEVFDIAIKVRRIGLEKPTDVSVPESPQEAENTPPLMLRRMRVAHG